MSLVQFCRSQPQEKNNLSRSEHPRVSDRTRPQVRSLEFGEDDTCFRSRASADSLRKINNRCHGGSRDRNGVLYVTRRSGYCAITTATTSTTPTTNFQHVISTIKHLETTLRTFNGCNWRGSVIAAGAKNCRRSPITS